MHTVRFPPVTLIHGDRGKYTYKSISPLPPPLRKKSKKQKKNVFSSWLDFFLNFIIINLLRYVCYIVTSFPRPEHTAVGTIYLVIVCTHCIRIIAILRFAEKPAEHKTY